MFEYRVKIQRIDGTFVEHPACSGKDPVIFAARQCSVPMSTLIAAEFFLVEQKLIVVTVEALNAEGYSIPSSENTAGAVIQVRPHTPPAAPRRGDLTTESSIDVVFDAVTADGGAPITTYEVWMDSGSGFGAVSTAPLLVSPATIVNPDITSGVSRLFKFRAQNVHGWSDFSPSFAIVSATIPTAPLNPKSSVQEFSTRAYFEWDFPANSGGVAIPYTAFKVFILKSDGLTFGEVPSTAG